MIISDATFSRRGKEGAALDKEGAALDKEGAALDKEVTVTKVKSSRARCKCIQQRRRME